MKTHAEVVATLNLDPVRVEAKRSALEARQAAFKLRELRKQAAMTQVEVAAKLGVAQTMVSQIESGAINRSLMSTLERYVEALGGKLEVSAVFGDQRFKVT